MAPGCRNMKHVAVFVRVRHMYHEMHLLENISILETWTMRVTNYKPMFRTEYCPKLKQNPVWEFDRKKRWRISLPDMKYMRLRSMLRLSLNIEYQNVTIWRTETVEIFIFLRKALMIMNVKDGVIGRSILIQKGKIKRGLKENFAILNPTINNWWFQQEKNGHCMCVLPR
jgi:hypothetical protein